MKELHEMTAVELRKAIRQGKIRIEDLVRHYLARIAKYDGPNGLNAVSQLNQHALEQAQEMDRDGDDGTKPLYGLPVLVKDNIDVAGMATTAGSFVLAGNIARKDAPVIANLRRNGAIILGKTNMTEFANYTSGPMPNGFSSLGGQVRNAYDREKDPSGSSTGSAVAMSAGFCAAAVGTDTSFSVVACAAENGVVGLKPAHGTLSVEGIVPIAHTLDSAGALTKCARDAILLVSAMKDEPLPATEPASLAGLRVGVNTFHREMISRDKLACHEALFDALRERGARLEEVEHGYAPQMLDVMRCEFREDLEAYLKGAHAKPDSLAQIIDRYEAEPEKMPYGIDTLQSALPCSMSDEAYISAMAERERLRAEMLPRMREYDTLVMTGPTYIMHFLGLPSISLKLCMAEDDTPRGVILYGAEEQKLFAAALAIEKCCGGVYPPKLED